MAATETAALRKRQQIAKANRMMFIWVAAASALIGTSLVLSFLLFQNLMYNQKVLSAKLDTVKTLKENNKTVDALVANVRLLETNQDLASTRISSEENTLQVVLDALPADANPLAFGASLQSKLLSGIDGLVIDSASVDPVSTVSSTGAPSQESGKIDFRFTVIGSEDALTEVLTRLEQSIRAINITALTTESSGGKLELSVVGYTYYEPAIIVGLKDETVPR